MKSLSFVIKFCILLIVQVLIWVFCNFSPLVTVTLLPMMIMCLPVKQDTLLSMLIAFAAGLAVNFFADGMLGLASFALVPVAFSRKLIIRMVFGSEILIREETPSARRNGLGKILMTSAIATSLYLVLYIWVDGAGTRTFGFNLLRFALSLALSLLVSIFTAIILDPEDK